MNNEGYEILEDDVTEHANLPKISVNSPSFIHKNSVEIIDKGCYNSSREELNLNKRISDKKKLILKLENNSLNKKVIYEKIYISNSNRNCLTKSQRIGNNKNIRKKLIKNSPKIENGFRNTIEVGNHILNNKEVFHNGIVNSEQGEPSPHNINHLNKKIIKKNIINTNKNDKKNTINGNELQQKPKKEHINSQNIILRGNKRVINRSKDFNNIKNDINKSLKLKETKQIVEQEISKINIKKISIINGKRIHSIKCFNSNSSQALFNNNYNSVKEIPHFKKMNSELIENGNEHKLLFNANSELNINSYLKRGNTNEIKNNFYSKINLKRNNLLNKSANFNQSESITSDMNNNDNKDINNTNNITNNLKLELNLMKSLKKEEEQLNNKIDDLDKVLNQNVSFENKEKNNIDNKDNSKDKEEVKKINEEENENKNDIIFTEKNIDENEEGIRRFRSRRLTLPPIKSINNIKINNNLKDNNKENFLNFNEDKNEIEIQKNKGILKEENIENMNEINIIKKGQVKEIEIEKEVEIVKKNEKEKEKEIKVEIGNKEKKEKERENKEKNKEKDKVNKEKEKDEKIILIENNLPNNNEKERKKEKSSKSNNNKKIKNKKKDILINNFKSHYSLSKAGKDELGNSKTNQDTYIILTNINGLKHFNIFGVLDGHGPEGHLVSQYIAHYFELEFQNHPKLENVKNIETIYSILKSKDFEIIKKIFINADHVLKKEEIDYKNSGTTCVIVIHIGEHIICANAGDSRAILIFDEENDENLNNIKVFPLSFDNKPENPQEKERIIKMGGEVEKIRNKKGHGIGPYRVWVKNKDYPGLAMSRSIGDFHGKKVGVIADPEIIEYNLSINSKFITICSDGVWEFLNNEDVMNIGKKFYLENNPRGFCKELIHQSIQYWEKEDSTIDDITAVIVFF